MMDIDMRSRFGPARDQGARPTCLAFAMSDAHGAAHSQNEPFAPDYAHYHAARRLTATMNEPVSTTAIRDALEQDGQPAEALCTYADPRDDKWVPPADVGQVWKRKSSVASGASASATLFIRLAASRAVVLTLRVSKAFFAPDPLTFEVGDDATASTVGEHAVVVVGARGAGTFFLVRNSWGATWGDNGHAWLAKRYVDARAIDVVEF